MKYLITREGLAYGPRGLLKPYPDSQDYLRVTMYIEGKRINKSVHRWVAETYLPNPENKPQVNHKDGDKSNNHIDNLEWVTCSENQFHAFQTGLKKRGEDFHRAKISDADVKYIRDNFISSSRKFGAASLGKEFGISTRYVFNLLNNNYRS